MAITTLLGWLGDIVGTHVYVLGVPKALRRRWNFLGGITAVDNPTTETLDLTFNGGANLVGAPDVSISGRDVISGATRDTLITSTEDTTIDAELVVKIGVNDANSVEIGHAAIEVKGGGARATGWADPSDAQDLATKAYADALVAGGVPTNITNNVSLTGPGNVTHKAGDGFNFVVGDAAATGAPLTAIRSGQGGMIEVRTTSASPTQNGGDVDVSAEGDLVLSGFATTSGVSLRAGGQASRTLSSGEVKIRGDLGVSIRANGAPAAPSSGQVLIVGSAVEITGTLTNNGSPISGSGASISDSGASVDTTGGDVATVVPAGGQFLVTVDGDDIIDIAPTTGVVTIKSKAGAAVELSQTSGGGFFVDASGHVSVETATGGDIAVTADNDLALTAGGVITEIIGSSQRAVTVSGANRSEVRTDAAGSLACTDLYDNAACSRTVVGTYTIASGGTTVNDLVRLRAGSAGADLISANNQNYVYVTNSQVYVYGGGNQLAQFNSTGIGFFGSTPVAKPSALTAAIGGTINSGDATTDTEIANMRTRIAQLESKLQSLGLLS